MELFTYIRLAASYLHLVILTCKCTFLHVLPLHLERLSGLRGAAADCYNALGCRDWGCEVVSVRGGPGSLFSVPTERDSEL